jgi:hypothetical protein
MRGTMTSAVSLTDTIGGIRVVARHDDIPSGVPQADAERGWRIALSKPAALVESLAG